MSVSVYSGYDPTDDASPTTPAEAAADGLLDQPLPSQRDYVDRRRQNSSPSVETSTQQADQQSSTDTATEEPVSCTTLQNGTLKQVSIESLEHKHRSPVEQPLTVSASTAQQDGELTTVSLCESTKIDSIESRPTVLPTVANVHKAHQEDQSTKQRSDSNSDYVSSISSRLRVGASKPEESVVKFGNMLDHCYSEGSDADIPKVVRPATVKPGSVKTKSDLLNKRRHHSATGTTQIL